MRENRTKNPRHPANPSSSRRSRRKQTDTFTSNPDRFRNPPSYSHLRIFHSPQIVFGTFENGIVHSHHNPAGFAQKPISAPPPNTQSPPPLSRRLSFPSRSRREETHAFASDQARLRNPQPCRRLKIFHSLQVISILPLDSWHQPTFPFSFPQPLKTTAAKIVDLRAFVREGADQGADYHAKPEGHWINSTVIAPGFGVDMNPELKWKRPLDAETQNVRRRRGDESSLFPKEKKKIQTGKK